ncbi:acetate kinase [Ligilactobacillus salivarius]|uniref:acetate kinase n=1 Tax=Ligilactobacillus salivarius TaxID=1624 RepID=UPI00136CF1C0|nr:acetate kinase [Ligilactobacillus salivarius]MYU60597.1 acetate kinase [Ligilactobacillus salivarius]MYV03475.1 acetate kinase [Ligilactobacillus salivarius]MYV21316.1 acetate kinase [Ligilactobacillus salivarius]MYY23465.1 acetate kinase [Ligilactobacillus salivarius]MYY40129.1 acetate kinase [Ligilactobacillus salivarius]
MKKIIVINSGSSSLKFKLFESPSKNVLASGLIERIGLDDSIITIKYNNKKYREVQTIKDHTAAVDLLLQLLKKLNIVTNLNEISAVGHRVVAGGEYFKKSVPIDSSVIEKIEDIIELAPLHNPANLVGIKVFKKLLPNALSVAAFDTAFHQTLPEENFMYSTPYEWYKNYGVRRYGAHGISHRYVSLRAAKLMGKPVEDLKLVTCHLGAGASITAVKNGKSFDTSMGFTPLTGIQMATRSGDVDVSLVAYMMKKLKVKSVSEILYMLNKESGFLGVSGVSLDMRDVEAAAAKNNKRAELAIKLFYNDIIKYIGQYYMEMEGIDGIVFTAGIGENSPETREAIMNKLSFLGVTINKDENSKRGTEGIVSGKDSSITVMRIPTDEEYMICCDVEALMNK